MPDEQGDIRTEHKREIIEREIALWKNTRYQGEIRARAGKQAGDQEYAARGLADVERSEKMLDALNALLHDLPGEEP